MIRDFILWFGFDRFVLVVSGALLFGAIMGPWQTFWFTRDRVARYVNSGPWGPRVLRLPFRSSRR